MIEDLPQEGIGYFYRGRANLEKRNYDGAIKDLDRAIALTPKNFGAFHYRGQAYADKGDYDRAIRDYDAALKLNPALADTRRHRDAAIQRKNGSVVPADPTQAKSERLQVVQQLCGSREKTAAALARIVLSCTLLIQDPSTAPANLARALLNRGAALIGTGDHDNALADFSNAVAREPKNMLAWSERCRVRGIRGEFDAALKDCAEALRLKPNDASALQSRAFVNFKRGALEASIADYDAAFRQDPSNAGALFGRGMAKEKNGDVAGGQADMDAALAMGDKPARR